MTANLLPRDGTARYFGTVIPRARSAGYFQTLLETVPWENDVTVLFGKRIVTARKVAWYGDTGFAYKYSGTTKTALPWSPVLQELKALAESLTGTRFNSCLLNLYHDGSEGMGWHSDNESTIVPASPIASLSFGAPRRFAFRHKTTRETLPLVLEDGSLLTMEDTTQTHWQHSVPKSKKVTGARINLTFRCMLAPRTVQPPPRAVALRHSLGPTP